MTIEAYLQSIATDLKRIADTLESNASPAVEADPDIEAAQNKPTRKPEPAAAKGKAKSKTSKEKAAPAEDGPALEDVRKALTSLQNRINSAAARGVLEAAGGATTLGKLDPSKYAAVIEAADNTVAK